MVSDSIRRVTDVAPVRGGGDCTRRPAWRVAWCVLAVLLPGVLAANPIQHHRDLGWVGKDLRGVPCTGRGAAYGPIDYNAPWAYPDSIGLPRDREIISRVETAHFTPKVRRLVNGHAGTLMADLDYTLRSVPNHHPALYSVIEYYFQVKRGRAMYPGDRQYLRPECYLQRAIKYRPADPANYLLLGLFLHRLGQYEDALQAYEKGLEQSPKFAELHYNMGLALFELERWEDSREHAEKAYEYGYPLAGLKRKLTAAGHW